MIELVDTGLCIQDCSTTHARIHEVLYNKERVGFHYVDRDKEWYSIFFGKEDKDKMPLLPTGARMGSNCIYCYDKDSMEYICHVLKDN